MSPKQQLGLVRQQLDLLAAARLDGPLDFQSLRDYWELCDREEQLLNARLVPQPS
jgi:hypothetical protein